MYYPHKSALAGLFSYAEAAENIGYRLNRILSTREGGGGGGGGG